MTGARGHASVALLLLGLPGARLFGDWLDDFEAPKELVEDQPGQRVGPSSSGGLLVFFFGPAGAGKSTLAAAWCETRQYAVQIQLDEIRSLIVSGLADPQGDLPLVSEQYETAAEACCALARVFLAAGYDVAVDDVGSPGGFERDWRPHLHGIRWRLVVMRPDVETVLSRNQGRAKDVRPDIVRQQHVDAGAWPEAITVDTTGLSVPKSLQLVLGVLERGGD